MIEVKKMNGIVSQKRQHKKQKESTLLLLTQNDGRLMESDSANKQTWSGGQKTAKIRDEGENMEEIKQREKETGGDQGGTCKNEKRQW